MLQLNQIRALLAAHIPVKHYSHRSVVFDYPSFSGSGESTLYHAHPNDEASQDWRKVEDGFDPSQYAVNTLAVPGQVYQVCIDDLSADMTKVVRFNDPRKQVPGQKPRDVLVLVHMYKEENPDEVATETAIEELMKRGWSATEAQAILVI